MLHQHKEQLMTYQVDHNKCKSSLIQEYGGMPISPSKEYNQQCNGLTVSMKRCKRQSQSNNQYCSIHASLYKYDCPQDCPICFESMKTSEIRPTVCGHFMHNSCLQQWLNSKHQSCPVCRTQLIKTPPKCELILQLPNNSINENVTYADMMEAFQLMLNILRSQNILIDPSSNQIQQNTHNI